MKDEGTMKKQLELEREENLLKLDKERSTWSEQSMNLALNSFVSSFNLRPLYC